MAPMFSSRHETKRAPGSFNSFGGPLAFGEIRMKRTVLFLTATLLVAPLALLSQTDDAPATGQSLFSSSRISANPIADGGLGQAASPMGRSYRGFGAGSEGPFSRVAVAGGLSPLGIQLEAATNLSGHLGLRGTGSFFNYSTNFTSNGISATGKLNLSSARLSLDVYPFRAGFRVSPGVLLNNQNQVTATANVPPGTSFTLNGQTYYSATANAVTGATPITGSGTLGLNTNNPAFTATAGWGNLARGKGHWSIPAEVGVAFIGAPTLKVNLSGWACYDQAQTQCASIAGTGNPIATQVQSNLATQVSKWTSDLEPLKTYPIVSVGVAYSFHVR